MSRLLVSILLAITFLSAVARAERPALLTVEAQAGEGISIGGGGSSGTITRLAPLTLTLLADYAIRTDPWVSFYGGLRGETRDRASVGAVVGLRVRPTHAGLRFGAGIVAILAPYTIAGVSGAGGVCVKLPKTLRGFAVCGDLEATAYLLGSDLPAGRVAAQLQLVLGVSFDAL